MLLLNIAMVSFQLKLSPFLIICSIFNMYFGMAIDDISGAHCGLDVFADGIVFIP